jgi:HD-GYP domain-containing protein (c-di-GMP phosphodiesterase class II)
VSLSSHSADVGAPAPSPPVRRAELLAALSLAADLGMGRPLESALRTAIVSIRLGAAAGFAPRDLKDVYQVALLRHTGCTAEATAAAAALGGDELAGRRWLALVDEGRRRDVIRTLAQHLGQGASAVRRAQLLAKVVVKLPRLAADVEARCEVAQGLAAELGCTVRVRQALGHAFERWDGKGGPKRLRGEALALAARVVQVADDAQMFFSAGGGLAAVTAMLTARAGQALDPVLARVMREQAATLLAGLDTASLWDDAIAMEPGAPEYLDDPALDVALRALGAFADLQSSYTRGHSAGVAGLAAAAAERMGLPPEAIDEIRRAGWVHDVGRTGVSAAVWEKEGPLSEAEWERVRMHTKYTGQVLARPPLLARLAALGTLDHERVDGTGYQKLPAASLSEGARLLAVADMYQAMRETRPYRQAIAPGEVSATLNKEAEAGRLDRAAVEAVLAAAGERDQWDRASRSGGLSVSEIDVLGLAARGRTDREIARTLEMSVREVREHLQHIYDKIGVGTRAGAALFAMRHGMIGNED